jgi:V/A-type H+-transporting ATPase subunit C
MMRPALAAEDLEGLLDACRRLSYYSQLKKAVEQSRRDGSMHHIRDSLDHVFLGMSKDFSYRYPLSILPIMDYMIRKENEVRNLRAMTRGKSQNLSTSQIESMLLV